MGVQLILNQSTPLENALMISGFVGINLIFLFMQRWAWNRRAERLSREPISPDSNSTAAPGVWPPPPNVSEAD